MPETCKGLPRSHTVKSPNSSDCGHLSPLLLCPRFISRDTEPSSRDHVWLESTSTVMGLFEEWQSQVVEVVPATATYWCFTPAELPRLSTSRVGSFGEERLVDALLAHHQMQVPQVLQFLFDEYGNSVAKTSRPTSRL